MTRDMTMIEINLFVDADVCNDYQMIFTCDTFNGFKLALLLILIQFHIFHYNCQFIWHAGMHVFLLMVLPVILPVLMMLETNSKIIFAEDFTKI